MNTGIKLQTIQKLALGKGLVFVYDELLECYVVNDKITGEMLMEYANITVALITSIRTWQEEFNKLKAQSYR